MKNPIHIFILFLVGLLSINTQAQTTEELFTKDGLSISAYYIDDVNYTTNASYTYSDKTTYCGLSAQEYIGNGLSLYLHFDDQKVFRIHRDSSLEKLYDFGMSVGDSINTSLYKGYVLREIKEIELLNGEKRRKFNFAVDTTDFIIKSWVEGIGDISRGLVPCCPFEASTQFVCAKINDELLLEGNRSNELCDSLSCLYPRGNLEIIQNDLTISVEGDLNYYQDITWDFGDGTTSNEVNPTHTYNEPGCYKITQTTTPLCNDSVFTSIQEMPICIKSPWQIDEDRNSKGGGNIVFLNKNFGFLYKGISLYRTTNSGYDWQEIAIDHDEDLYIVDVKIFENQKCILSYRSQNDFYDFQIYTSDDGGLTWSKVNTADISDAFSGVLFISEATGKAILNNQFDAWISLDYGHTWEKMNFPTSEFGDFEFKKDIIYATGNEILYPNGKTSFYKSLDNGNSWGKVAENVGFYRFSFYDNDFGFGFGAYGDPNNYVTHDGGKTWAISSIPGYSVAFLNDKIMFSGTSKSVDGGETFVDEVCGSTFRYRHMYAFDENAIFGTFQNKFYKYVKATVGCQTDQTTNLNNVAISISPNPASSTLEIHSKIAITAIEIVNIQGQIIEKLNNSSSVINISHLQNGIYLLKVQDQNGLIMTEKFIKME